MNNIYINYYKNNAILIDIYRFVRRAQNMRLVIMVSISLLQVYSIGHIIYRKWIIYQQERQQSHAMSVFIIRLNDFEPHNLRDHRDGEVNLNTSSYNKVLVEVTHIIVLVAFVIIRLILRRIAQSYTSTGLDGGLEDIPKLTMYFCDLTPPILITFVFPMLFYVTHPKVGSYVRGLVC